MSKINKENLLDQMMRHLEKNLTNFIVSGVVGITLNGGLSRGYGDHLSEVDVTVYLDRQAYKLFNEGHLGLPEGICHVDGMLYDMKILSYEEELARDFSIITELWDLSYAKILYDKDDKINKLFQEKLKRSVNSSDAGGILFSAWWHIMLACDIWLYRENAFQGHFMLNEAIKPLMQSLYIMNHEFVPHEKWLVHYLDELKWLPYDFNELMTILLGTSDLTLEGLSKRQDKLMRLYQLINDKAGYDLTKKYFVDKIEMLLKKDEYNVDTFDELFGLRSLQSDPFRHFIDRVGDKVIVSKLKFLNINPNQMYEWHYSTVNLVQGQMTK